ncbi:MAG: TlpA family protein disulfide reductase [Chitinophagaceae bacterium]|nr:TlpA family protein disulfide reductase [Chitinophagaceae bacterium]
MCKTFFILFLFNALTGVSQKKINLITVKCVYDTTTHNSSEGGALEPLEIVSVNTSEKSQTVRYTFDMNHEIYNQYQQKKILKDSFLRYINLNSVDTANLNKWKKENSVMLEIRQLSDQKYKVIPDFNHSHVFTDDKIYYYKVGDGIMDRNGLVVPHNVNFWYGKEYSKKIDLIILPNVKTLPKKNTTALFNTWGGTRKIMIGKMLIGIDSFIVKIFIANHSVYYTKYNCLFSFSNPNENYIDILKTAFPVYSYRDSVFIGNKVIVLDSVNLIGDTVVFRELDDNNNMKGVQEGAFVKVLEGKNFRTENYEEIHLERHDGKYTLLHFWGSWCAPCVKNMPQLKNLFQNNQRAVQFIGFPYEIQKDLNNSKKIIEKYEMTWTQIIQPKDDPFLKADVIKKLKVNAFPTYILLDSQGKIILRTSDISEIEQLLKAKEL